MCSCFWGSLIIPARVTGFIPDTVAPEAASSLASQRDPCMHRDGSSMQGHAAKTLHATSQTSSNAVMRSGLHVHLLRSRNPPSADRCSEKNNDLHAEKKIKDQKYRPSRPPLITIRCHLCAAVHEAVSRQPETKSNLAETVQVTELEGG